jgi:hypothetical protein
MTNAALHGGTEKILDRRTRYDLYSDPRSFEILLDDAWRACARPVAPVTTGATAASEPPGASVKMV